MLEIAPGVYTSPNMTRSVRDRVWGVVRGWFIELGGGSVVLTWRAPDAPGGQGIEILGSPPKSLHDADGLILARLEHDSRAGRVEDDH
jgi:CRISPR-associated protein Cas2